MIKLILLLSYNIIRLTVSKIRYGNRYQSTCIARIHPLASVSLYQKGSIHVGRNIEVSPFTDIQIHGEGNLHISDGVYMNRFCMISCHGKISIGKGCMFGPGVKIFDNNHRFSNRGGVQSTLNIGSIVIGDNCWIASDAIILKGAKIGNNCVIGAGCIIDYTVSDNTIVRNKQTHSIQEIIK